MKKLLLVLITLLFSKLIFAETAQNHVILINNEIDLNMKIYYSTCYSYRNWLYIRNDHCEATQLVTLYAKNNSHGPQFADITWPKTDSVDFEYLKINNIVVNDFEEKHFYNFNDQNYFVYTSNSDPNADYHTAIILSLPKHTLKIQVGVF